jgi:hypothetical protein
MAHGFEFPASVEIVQALERVDLSLFVRSADGGHEAFVEYEQRRFPEIGNRFGDTLFDRGKFRLGPWLDSVHLGGCVGEGGEEKEKWDKLRHVMRLRQGLDFPKKNDAGMVGDFLLKLFL